MTYHFENGYHADVYCEHGKDGIECCIEVTGNSTHVRIVHLTMGECADNLVKIRDQRQKCPSDLEQLRRKLSEFKIDETA